MKNTIFRSLIIVSFISITSSTHAISSLLAEASSLVRPLFRSVARSTKRSYGTYAVATYDSAFKEIMMDETARNSFFTSVIEEDVTSSEPISLATSTKKSQNQVAADTIGDFLEEYASVMSKFIKDHPPKKETSKRVILSLESFAKEMAYTYYRPLCNLFPSQSKKSYMDFSCRLKSGDVVLVETQVRPQDYWNQRALAYAARAYSNQLMEGESWGKLKKVYSINILGGVEYSSVEKVDTYTWRTKVTPMKDKSLPFVKRYEITNFYDSSDKIPHLQIIQLFPQLFDPTTPTSESNVQLHPSESLKEWLELFKEAHKKDKNYVKEHVKDQGVQNAYGILAEHEPSDQYKKWKEMFGPKVAEQLVQFKEKERTEGRTEGRAEGKKEGINEVAQNLLKSKTKMSLEEIANLTGLSIKEVQTLSETIKQQEKKE